MHVVIVDGDISYPPTSGKRLRTLNLLLPLARRHRLTYVGRGDSGLPEFAQAREFLADHGIEPILVDHPVKRKSGLGFLARLAANQFSSLPYSVQSHWSKPMREVVQAYASAHAIDLWQLEWAPYLATVPSTIPGPRLVIAHNVDTQIWQRYARTGRGLFQRAFLGQQCRRFARFEATAFRQATRVVAVSLEDAQMIREQFGQPNVDVVDNGIDQEYFSQVAPQPGPPQILFLGALDWRPNLDAIDQLLDRIFPEVLRHEPEARLVIVGRQPPPGLSQRVARLANVELHANVPDVRPYLARASVMAVPLRIGGGSRLKILEALACALPVVSTRIGAEGLQLTAGQEFIAAEVEEMAAALVLALRNPARTRAMAELGRRLVLDQYDWKVLADRLEQSWEKCQIGNARPTSLAANGNP